MDVRVGPKRKLTKEEWILLNCGAGKLLRVPWTERKSNQSILKEINPKYLLEGLMLKLKLQHFGQVIQRADSLEKTLMLGKTEEKGATEHEMLGWHHWLNGHEQIPGEREGHVLPSMGLQRVKHDVATKQQLIHGTVSYPSPSALHSPTIYLYNYLSFHMSIHFPN